MMKLLCLYFLMKVSLALTDVNQCERQVQNETEMVSILGSHISLQCNINSTSGTYIWTRMGHETIAENLNINPKFTHGKTYNVSLQNNLYSLLISGINQSDQGRYCCQTRTDRITVMHCVHLRIFEINLSTDDNNSTILGDDDRNTTISCYINISGYNGTLEWIWNNTEISSSDSAVSNLTLQVTKDFHMNKITCRAFIPCLNMSFEKDVVFKVANEPEVTIIAHQATTVNESQDVNLSCRYNSTTMIKSVFWSKDNVVIANFSRLLLRNVSQADAGLYMCTVNNTVGSGRDTIKLTVLHVQVSVVQLENGSLYCNISDNTHVNKLFKWKHFTEHGQLVWHFNGSQSGICNVEDVNGSMTYKVDGRYQCDVFDANNSLVGRGNIYLVFNAVSTKQKNTNILVVYILICASCVCVLLLSTLLYTRLHKDDSQPTGIKSFRRITIFCNKQTDNDKVIHHHVNSREETHEEVELNPDQNGSRFVVLRC